MRPSRSLDVLDLDGSLALLRRSLRRLRGGSDFSFEPEDAEDAAGVSELTTYLANVTQEMLGCSDEWSELL